MNVKTDHEPWQPSQWVGGQAFTRPDGMWTIWLDAESKPVISLSDDSRAKYAAVKATAAILKAMRK